MKPAVIYPAMMTMLDHAFSLIDNNRNSYIDTYYDTIHFLCPFTPQYVVPVSQQVYPYHPY